MATEGSRTRNPQKDRGEAKELKARTWQITFDRDLQRLFMSYCNAVDPEKSVARTDVMKELIRKGLQLSEVNGYTAALRVCGIRMTTMRGLRILGTMMRDSAKQLESDANEIEASFRAEAQLAALGAEGARQQRIAEGCEEPWKSSETPSP